MIYTVNTAKWKKINFNFVEKAIYISSSPIGTSSTADQIYYKDIANPGTDYNFLDLHSILKLRLKHTTDITSDDYYIIRLLNYKITNEDAKLGKRWCV